MAVKLPPIDMFVGDYRFLSNFDYSPGIILDGVEYDTVEHAYNAAKTLDYGVREQIRLCITPGEAKKMGKHVKLRKGWDNMRLSVMSSLIKQKFAIEAFKIRLRHTEGRELIHGGWWQTNKFWGKYQGVGENHLGKIIMAVRDGKPTPAGPPVQESLFF